MGFTKITIKILVIAAALISLPLIVGIVFIINSNIKSTDTLVQARELQNNSPVNKLGNSERFKNYQRPGTSELRNSLSPIQYAVTQEDSTETPYENSYWDLKEDGIYVDVVSGEPLFSSRDKYDSGTGWPSFTKPLNNELVIVKEDSRLGLKRIEARSRYANSHLGHIFNDGPATLDESEGAEPTGLRYCMNSASLRFVPKAELVKEGIGEYISYL